ncbi:MAG: hypothetical protein AAB893_04665 [Patescibacteria group bacterium]
MIEETAPVINKRVSPGLVEEGEISPAHSFGVEMLSDFLRKRKAKELLKRTKFGGIDDLIPTDILAIVRPHIARIAQTESFPPEEFKLNKDSLILCQGLGNGVMMLFSISHEIRLYQAPRWKVNNFYCIDSEQSRGVDMLSLLPNVGWSMRGKAFEALLDKTSEICIPDMLPMSYYYLPARGEAEKVLREDIQREDVKLYMVAPAHEVFHAMEYFYYKLLYRLKRMTSLNPHSSLRGNPQINYRDEVAAGEFALKFLEHCKNNGVDIARGHSAEELKEYSQSLLHD